VAFSDTFVVEYSKITGSRGCSLDHVRETYSLVRLGRGVQSRWGRWRRCRNRGRYVTHLWVCMLTV